MNRQELIDEIQHKLPVEQADLPERKISSRAENIREHDHFIIFEVERHPGAGNQFVKAYTQLETWRYDRETDELRKKLQFSKEFWDSIEQNQEGDPVCKHCGELLDRFDDVFEKVWSCSKCGTHGGCDQELFDPSYGGKSTALNKEKYKKVDDYWVRKDRNE